MHTNVVSTPAKPNKASRLARKEKKTWLAREKKRYTWNRLDSFWLLTKWVNHSFRSSSHMRRWSELNDSPVKTENSAAKFTLSHNSIWITDNLFQAAALPSTWDNTINSTGSPAQVEAAGVCVVHAGKVWHSLVVIREEEKALFYRGRWRCSCYMETF